jgi:hypothetical protein
MTKGVSLIGVDLPYTYQLGVVAWGSYLSLVGNQYPTVCIALLNCETGDIIPAGDMPVKYNPGWLIQGPHKPKDKDTDVSHAQVSGEVLPPEVSSTLGASFPIQPNTANTGFYFLNGAPTGYMKRYANFGTTTSNLINTRAFHFERPALVSPVTGCTGTKTTVSSKGKTVYTWTFDSLSYQRVVTVTLTGSLHVPLSGQDLSPNLLQGSSVSKILTKRTGTWTTTNSSTTGLVFFAFTPPSNTSSLLSSVIIANMEAASGTSISKDLMSLSELPSGNEEWKAIQYAIDSYRYFDGSTLEMGKDLIHYKQLIPPLRNFAQLASPKMWSQLFLWFKYGVLPTIHDVIAISDLFKTNRMAYLELVNNFAKSNTKYGTAYAEEAFNDLFIELKCNARVTARPRLRAENAFERMFLLLKSLNIGITARNVWDLVPYSFVVDWFVNTSEAASFLDYAIDTCAYDLDKLVLSNKRTLRTTTTGYFPGSSGAIDLTVYNRHCHKTFPPKHFEFEALDPSSHWVEGAALLMVRK